MAIQQLVVFVNVSMKLGVSRWEYLTRWIGRDSADEIRVFPSNFTEFVPNCEITSNIWNIYMDIYSYIKLFLWNVISQANLMLT